MASLSLRRKELSLFLEPRTLLALLSRRHAANQLCLVGATVFAGGSGTDTGHAGKGQIFLSLLAVTVDNARFEAVELSAVGGKLKVSGEVSFQQGRAKVLRHRGVICALASKVDSCCNRVTHYVRY